MDPVQTVDTTAVPSPEHQTDIFISPSQQIQRQHATAAMLASLLDVWNDGTATATADNTTLNEKTCLPKGLLDFDRSDSSSAPNGLATILDFLYSDRASTVQSLPPIHATRSTSDFAGHQRAGVSSIRHHSARASYSDGMYKGPPAAEQEGSWNVLTRDPHDLSVGAGVNRHDGTMLNGALGPRIGRTRILSDFSGQFSDPKIQYPYAPLFRNGSLDCNCIEGILSRGYNKSQDSFGHLPSRHRPGGGPVPREFNLAASGPCWKVEQMICPTTLNAEAESTASVFGQPSLQRTQVYTYLSFQGTTLDAAEPYQTEVVKTPEICSAIARPGRSKTFFCIEWQVGCLSKLVASSESEKVIVSPQFLTKTNLKNLWMMLSLLPPGGAGSDAEQEEEKSFSNTPNQGNFFSVQLTSTSSTTVTFGIECDGVLWEENRHCFKDSPWSTPTMIGPIAGPQLEKLKITIKFFEIFSPEIDDATTSSKPSANLGFDLTKRVVSAALPQKTAV